MLIESSGLKKTFHLMSMHDRSEKKNRNVYIPLYEIDTRRAVPRASVAVWPRSKKKRRFECYVPVISSLLLTTGTYSHCFQATTRCQGSTRGCV